MRHAAILPDPDALRLDGLTGEADEIVLEVRAAAEEASCPACGAASGRVHSWYGRAVADLPWQGVPVRLRLRVRRFFCDNAVCARRIFAERLAGVVVPYGRRTVRLEAWLRHIAFALAGRPGARLLHDLGLVGGRDALLARVRAAGLADAPTPRVLSVDDFALRRGRTYGTILVDLERHRVVDLLPDRSGAALAAWLAPRRGIIEVISRDRGGEYADGARRGAPGAVQVADRFHLLRNLSEVVLRVLRRHAALVRHVPAPATAEAPRLPLSPDRQASRDRTRREMAALFAAVQALAARGMNNMAIARALGVHRHTARKYRAFTAAPERRHVWRRPSILAPHQDYLGERWRQGCRNARTLWHEIEERGYPGTYRGVARIVAELKRRERGGEPLAQPATGLIPRQALGLLLARADRRSPEEALAVERLLAQHADLRRAGALLDGFGRLIRERTDQPDAAARLARWEAEARAAGLPEADAFVTKLRQDRDAVLGALTLPWSQGQAEGQVNRLKSIKRAMYGRAKFDLLRKRVLHAAA